MCRPPGTSSAGRVLSSSLSRGCPRSCSISVYIVVVQLDPECDEETYDVGVDQLHRDLESLLVGPCWHAHVLLLCVCSKVQSNHIYLPISTRVKATLHSLLINIFDPIHLRIYSTGWSCCTRRTYDQILACIIKKCHRLWFCMYLGILAWFFTYWHGFFMYNIV